MKAIEADQGPELGADLVSRAALDGRAWAESVRASLADEGRPACGGWPGTLSEARARVDRNAAASPSAREQLSRLLYESARTFWLENREPHVQEPSYK